MGQLWGRVEHKKVNCYICGRLGENHHIHTRKAGGGDEPSNLIALCRQHHQEIHRCGVKTTTKKYRLPIDTSNIYPKRSDK
jgi:hypothetical protein